MAEELDMSKEIEEFHKWKAKLTGNPYFASSNQFSITWKH